MRVRLRPLSGTVFRDNIMSPPSETSRSTSPGSEECYVPRTSCVDDTASKGCVSESKVVTAAPDLGAECRNALKKHFKFLLFFSVANAAAALLLPLTMPGKSTRPPVAGGSKAQFVGFLADGADSHPNVYTTPADHLWVGIFRALFQAALCLHLERELHTGSRWRNLIQRALGLFSASVLVIHLTCFAFGGLPGKMVFFPDVWLFHLSRWVHRWVGRRLPALDLWWESMKYRSIAGSLLHQAISPVIPLPNSLEALDSMHSLVNFLAAAKVVIRNLSAFLLVGPEALWMAVSFFINFTVVITCTAIDTMGLVLRFRTARRFAIRRDLSVAVCAVGIVAGVGSLYTGDPPGCVGTDSHWLGGGHLGHAKVYDAAKPPLFTSKYLPMRDGVQLAVDIFFPKEYVEQMMNESPEEGSEADHPKLPTFLAITRYNRRMTVLWPFSLLRLWGQPRGPTANVYNYQLMQSLTANGYAVVIADARGTGSSFGSRHVDLSPEEVGDFKTLVEWSRQQFWSDRTIATGGISYDGMTGLYAGAQGNVSATVALFTPIDVISDMLQPGGIVCTSFLKDYKGLTLAFEREGSPLSHLLQSLSYPWHIAAGFITTFNNVAAVRGREELLQAAVREHQYNWDMERVVSQVRFKDESFRLPDGRLVEVSNVGITEPVLDGLAKHNVSVYAVGGYCDSSGVRGQMRLHRHVTTRNPQAGHKLIVGPWTHTGRRSCSPHSRGTYPCFEQGMYLDIVRYLDCHLKGKCWGQVTEEIADAPVHFWQVGAEVWQSSRSFPPPSVRYRKFYFSKDADSQRNIAAYRTDNDASNTHSDSERDALTIANDFSDFVGRGLTAIRALRAPPVSFPQLLADNEGRSSSDNLFAMVENPADSEDTVEHKVSYDATSGLKARWVVAPQAFRSMVEYSTEWIKSQEAQSLMFATAPLEEALEVIGSVWLTLSMALPGLVKADELGRSVDISVFAYLEEVTSAGEVFYISEGRALLSHRADIKVPCEYDDEHEDCDASVPIGSPEAVFQAGTQEKLKHATESVEELNLTFEPVAWTIRDGHQLRIRLVGSDVDNFDWAATARKAASYLPDNFPPLLPSVWRIPLDAKTRPIVRIPVQL